MQTTKIPTIIKMSVALCCATLLSTSGALAATEKVLHTFNTTDGGQTVAKLVLDANGNLYGTTPFGGRGFGVVYQLVPSGTGYTTRIIRSFTGGNDGANPNGGLILDAAGNLYGTAIAGGAHGYGVVFELKPKSTGGWAETVLWAFTGGIDEGKPYNALVWDNTTGNFYGTTGGVIGGQSGTLFRLSPKTTGGFSMRVLHTFTDGTDGGIPTAVVLDGSGNIYGTAYEQGGTGCVDFVGFGVIYKFKLSTANFSVVHSFCGGTNDGATPDDDTLVFNSQGTLFGTTTGGGRAGKGTVFGFVPSGTFFLLHSFAGTDGSDPDTGLVVDAADNLYGAAFYGGTITCNCGTVYKLNSRTGAETLLYTFRGGANGANPDAALIFDSLGNLYSTTYAGGSATANAGVVYELTNLLASTQAPIDGNISESTPTPDTAGKMAGHHGVQPQR